LLTNNFIRGAVTGLGLVNLYAGFADLARVFAARPSSASGRPEPVDGSEARDLPIHDHSTPP
jgi:hypothetical protein